MSKKFINMNRVAWDQRAVLHFDSDFYDVAGFLRGNTSLREIELAELKDVSGRRLLHLQCHFGLDTLSWTRLGADCTGVDLSPVAIDKARQLSRQAGLNAEFVCANVYDFNRGAAEPFDIVFASYGVICWLPDLVAWAHVVAANLAEGGTFYLADFHPVHDLVTGYSYFETNAPYVEEEGTYTENGATEKTTMATWAHPVSSLVNALINAGIRVTRFNEFPFSPYNCFEGLSEREPGRYFFTHRGRDIPILYTISGEKVGASVSK